MLKSCNYHPVLFEMKFGNISKIASYTNWKWITTKNTTFEHKNAFWSKALLNFYNLWLTNLAWIYTIKQQQSVGININGLDFSDCKMGLYEKFPLNN